jgi:protein involved in polysaccharide export with SLBB domain
MTLTLPFAPMIRLLSPIVIAGVMLLTVAEVGWAQTVEQHEAGRAPASPPPETASEASAAPKILTTDGYKLGPLDKIRIKVYSWRASQDQIFEWTAINKNEDYFVGATGSVSVPLIGEISAADLTTAQLADNVALALKDRIGMVEKPDVAIEVAQFRPFYITGDVQKAGEYPYRPALTVMQATAIAGGPMRDPRSSSIRLEREIISSEGDLAVLLSERTLLLTRRARLQSELSGAQDILLPDELVLRKSDDDVRPVLEQERQIFKARLEGFSTQLQALEQLRDFFQTEFSSMEAQIKAQETEVAAVDRELAQVKTLAEKRLTTDTRLFGLQRNRAQVEGESLRLQSAMTRVKQDLSKTEISIIELRNKRTAEITADMATNTARIDTVEHQIGTARKLLAESEVMGSPPFLNLAQQKYEMSYKIIRNTSGQTIEIAANETTQVRPGDTVKVEIIRQPANVAVGRVSPTPEGQ